MYICQITTGLRSRWAGETWMHTRFIHRIWNGSLCFIFMSAYFIYHRSFPFWHKDVSPESRQKLACIPVLYNVWMIQIMPELVRAIAYAFGFLIETSLTWFEALKGNPGPCIATAIWRSRTTLSQWERSFHWKLRCHWLKGLRQHQDPDSI